MISFVEDCRIFIGMEPIDFRCGLNKLVPLAQERFQQDPRDHSIFVFRNRRSTDIKFIFFDRNGFFLGHKRLSQGKLQWWPRTDRECAALNASQLFTLLGGIDPRGSFHPGRIGLPFDGSSHHQQQQPRRPQGASHEESPRGQRYHSTASDHSVLRYAAAPSAEASHLYP